MKKRIVCIFLVVSILMFSTSVFAEDTSSSSNLISFDNNIEVNNDVDGNTYTFGDRVSIGTMVGGDIISAGRIIDIDSLEVKGNIRTAGQIVNINVESTKNITSAGETINIGNKTNANAIYLAARDIKFMGQTNDFYASGENIIIDGIIKGNLNVDCRTLTLTENAEVEGNIKVSSPNEPNLNSKTTLADIDYEKISNKNYQEKYFSKSNISWELMSLATAIIIGFIIYMLFKQSFLDVEKDLNGIFKYLLIGLPTLILLPIIAIFMMFTVIGIPIGIIALILYGIVIYLCPVVTGIILGKIIFRKGNAYLQVLGGIVIVKCILLVPYISVIVCLISVLLVLGFINMKIYCSVKRK